MSLRLVPSFLDIFHWKYPLVNFLLFSVGFLFFSCLEILSFFGLVSLVLLLHLLVTFLYANGMKAAGSNFEKGVEENAVVITEEMVESWVKKMTPVVNVSAVWLYNLYQCKRNEITLQMIGLLFGIHLLARIIATETIIFAVFALFFLIKPIYSLNSTWFDQISNNWSQRIFEKSKNE